MGTWKFVWTKITKTKAIELLLQQVPGSGWSDRAVDARAIATPPQTSTERTVLCGSDGEHVLGFSTVSIL